MRDDFKTKQKEALARRCGYICSRPDCGVHTSGPNEDPEKSSLIGIAAHITAASGGGPRYDGNLTSNERSSLNNAIWLCSNCATLIDKNKDAYPESLLRVWKAQAEQKMKSLQGKTRAINIDNQISRPIIEANFKNYGKMKEPMRDRVSSKNHFYEENGCIIMDGGSNPILFWKLTWNYQLVLQNSSSAYAINLRFDHLSSNGFTLLPSMPLPNRLPPYEQIELPIQYIQIIEETGYVAQAIHEETYSKKLEGMILRIRYKDSNSNNFQTLVMLNNNEITNTIE